MEEKKGKKSIWWKILIILGCLVILLVSFFIGSYYLVPHINLNGDKVIYLNVGDEYEDAGATANIHGKEINKEIKMSGQVDSHHKGTYKLTYEIKKGLMTSKVSRTIIVKDTEPPIIELVGDQQVTVCETKQYKELGYEVTDNADGDLSDKEVVKISDDEITYEVEDEDGNKATATRQIVVQKLVKPTIKLEGNSTVFLYQGNKYNEIGYKAYDDCGDDLTSKVVVKNNIDLKTLGTYTVTYEVQDSKGHKATATRKVNVTKKPTGGVIYLTFDDGPNSGTTDVILDILKKENVKATFFVTNKGPDSLIKREYDEGHTVALHTASHNYAKVYASVDAYFKDLALVHDRVLRITGYDAHIIRFPGGSSNTVSRSYQKGIMTTLTKEVKNRGYHYFDWNVDSNDAGGTTSATGVYNNVIKHLSRQRANVVLMHDIKTQTRDALEKIIKYGKENGYTFAPLTMSTPEVHHGVNN